MSRAEVTLREVYDFCREHAVDAEIHVKSDGRGGIRFYRVLDGARFCAPDFDFERDPGLEPHPPERSLALVRITEPTSLAERVRLETPR